MTQILRFHRELKSSISISDVMITTPQGGRDMLAKALVTLLLATPMYAAPQATKPAENAIQVTTTAADKAAVRCDDKKASEEAPVVTNHEIKLGGRVLKYTVTTGFLPLKNEKDEVEAKIFFMAYTAERPGGPDKRPLTFSFNGGPGSSSVWLHLGALGPKRVKMQDSGAMPAPPYLLVDNEHTWLDLTDLVFLDPVGTGFSRATSPELGKKFWSVNGDIGSIAEFIRLYLSRYQRWGSPLFMVGESYGTTRAAGLSGLLVERYGVAFNGIMLVSAILNFQTAEETKGNDLPYQLNLPTYTATAWFHKKLAENLQADLHKTLQEAETFASGEYALALNKGDLLAPAERQIIIEKLARLTGLGSSFIDSANLRITTAEFCKELLRAEKRTVGRLDGRFQGIDEKASGSGPSFDPSMAAIRPPYTAMFNDYVRRELGYKTDLHYFILGGGINSPWESPQGEFIDTSEALRSAFSRNLSMRLFVASGYYDFATPYFATEYTLAHMGLDPSQRSRISTSYYQAGHMMYIDTAQLAKLKKNVAAFIESALAK